MSVVALALWWVTSLGWAGDDLYYDVDPTEALELVRRDAGVVSSELVPVPWQTGSELRVVGAWSVKTCGAAVSGDALAAALREAEQDALDGLSDRAWSGVSAALDMFGCVDVAVRPYELARAHDLASALASLKGDESLAVDHAYQALVARPGVALALQASKPVRAQAQRRYDTSSPAALWLPTSWGSLDVLVDGERATGPTVQVWPGEHVVQVGGEGLVVQVPTDAQEAALVVPQPVSLDLTDPVQRGWVTRVLVRPMAPRERVWFVSDRRVWRADLQAGDWFRYETRPPRTVRPALIGLTTAGVLTGVVVGTVFAMRWSDRGRCGAPGANVAACAPYVDGTTGLIFDVTGLEDARRTDGAIAIAGTVVAGVSAVGLAVVAAASRSPRAVHVAVVPHLDEPGVGVVMQGVF